MFICKRGASIIISASKCPFVARFLDSNRAVWRHRILQSDLQLSLFKRRELLFSNASCERILIIKYSKRRIDKTISLRLYIERDDRFRRYIWKIGYCFVIRKNIKKRKI